MDYIKYIKDVRNSPLLFSLSPLSEYLSFSNLGDKINKTFLLDQPDECEQEEDCLYPCEEYNKKCVNPTRIKTFTNAKELSLVFTTSMGKFSIVDSTMYKKDLFYKIIL